MDYSLLQHYWWFLISLLGAILVFMLFVQGGQSMLYTLGKDEIEKSMIINSLGRKWEITFTTLVTFGGAFFASFPLFYSTSFGGAYWVWIAILICFVLQAVAYEFRIKSGNLLGSRCYEIFLLINGFGGVLLIGTAVGTFFSGSEFLIDKMNITDQSMPIISRWMHPARGLEAVLNIRNTMLGATLFLLSRSIAALYFMNNIDCEKLYVRARGQLILNGLPFVACLLTYLLWTLAEDGFAVDPATGEIFIEPFKYGMNYVEMPWLIVMLVGGVGLYIYGAMKSIRSEYYTNGIWFGGAGVILVVMSLLLCVGYNDTSYYPSTYDMQSSLTIANSSSSYVTLSVMSWASLLIPFVVAYIAYVWRALDSEPITREEMESTDHKY